MMIPSLSITRYVGIAGCSKGRSKERLVVNLLLTAPGKWTLMYDQPLRGVLVVLYVLV